LLFHDNLPPIIHPKSRNASKPKNPDRLSNIILLLYLKSQDSANVVTIEALETRPYMTGQDAGAVYAVL